MIVTPVRPGAGVLVRGPFSRVCTLGRAGVRREKREGDGATPVGRFALCRLLYRPDRFSAPPATRLACSPIGPDDGWCDEPMDASYNRQVKLPYPARAERLWRDDGLYDLVVVLGYNDDPPRAGAGSAIFLHVARDDGGPTDGCVGLVREELLRLLAAVEPFDRLEVCAAHDTPAAT